MAKYKLYDESMYKGQIYDCPDTKKLLRDLLKNFLTENDTEVTIRLGKFTKDLPKGFPEYTKVNLLDTEDVERVLDNIAKNLQKLPTFYVSFKRNSDKMNHDIFYFEYYR